MKFQQKGMVLLITVILLFVIGLLSLYSMRGTITQDKMTSNITNKLITTNAAEQGALEFKKWFMFRLKQSWPSGSDQNAWRNVAVPNRLELNVSEQSNSNGFYWINEQLDIEGCTTRNTNPCWNDQNHTVTAYVTGNLLKQSAGSTPLILGESIYKVVLGSKTTNIGKLPDLPAAITFGSYVNSSVAANSGNFKVNGGDKLAIATNDSNSAETIKNKLKDKNFENYTGSNCQTAPCIASTDLGIWNDPNKVMDLAHELETSGRGDVKVYQGDFTGNLESCSGIIIVHGSFIQNGNIGSKCNKVFNGVVLVLGGDFHVNGGGGMTINGAIYVADIVKDSNTNQYKFNSLNSTTNGSHMTINYDNKYLSNDRNSEFQGNQGSEVEVIAWGDVI